MDLNEKISKIQDIEKQIEQCKEAIENIKKENAEYYKNFSTLYNSSYCFIINDSWRVLKVGEDVLFLRQSVNSDIGVIKRDVNWASHIAFGKVGSNHIVVGPLGSSEYYYLYDEVVSLFPAADNVFKFKEKLEDYILNSKISKEDLWTIRKAKNYIMSSSLLTRIKEYENYMDLLQQERGQILKQRVEKENERLIKIEKENEKKANKEIACWAWGISIITLLLIIIFMICGVVK